MRYIIVLSSEIHEAETILIGVMSVVTLPAIHYGLIKVPNSL